MKNIYTCLTLFLMVLLSSCGSSKDFAQSYSPESQDITYQQFYDGLSPYGNWVDYQNYGYVWIPNEQNFRPYYNNGHWVYTNYGWTWVSGYNWGWAPFHYGRWLYDDAYGWMWTPGYEWAPAWVSWRDGSDCYGWAPLGPGMSFNRNMGSGIPDNYWAFVPRRYINSPRINNYYINREKNVTIINNTTVINNTSITNNKTVYVTGPAPAEVEKVTNQKIMPVRIIQKNAPGTTKTSGSTVAIYKPQVREIPQQNGQFKPARIVNLNEIRERRQNSGIIQNVIPGNDNRGNTAPVQNTTRPAANQNNTIIKPPVINEQPQVRNQQPPFKQPPVINKQPEVNNQQPPVINQQPPVINKQPQVINKQPEVNNQQPPVINKQPEVSNQQPPLINKQPEVINTPPVKVRVTHQPNNQKNVRENIPSVPANRQPVRIQQNDRTRPQRTMPDYKPANTAPVNHTPMIRNQPAAEPRGNIREIPPKERN